jgi:hypothetical protein
VNDFHSRGPEKWALKVVDHLFTKQELADHVIVVDFNKITNEFNRNLYLHLSQRLNRIGMRYARCV